MLEIAKAKILDTAPPDTKNIIWVFLLNIYFKRRIIFNYN